MSIKYYCLRCGKRVRWWQKVAVDEDIYRVPQEDGNIGIYRHRKIIHWNCLSKQEQKQIQDDSKRKDDDDDDTSNYDKIRTG